MIRFCFITGITKFSQLSIFSTLNNLTNILPYETEGREVVRVGVRFDRETMTIGEYLVG